MNADCEIIALLLDEGDGRPRPVSELARRAQYLTRNAAGHIELHPVESEAQFDRAARTTGCFRRGKPIHDPLSREVIGYEMESVSLRRATAGR